MNHVSPCCHADVVSDIKLEYPLGGNTWAIPYKVDRCESCGKEVEEYVEQCGVCGTVGCDERCE
jgi:hypothetical protein